MPDGHRFFDESVSRLRASGVIHPAKRQAVIPFPAATRSSSVRRTSTSRTVGATAIPRRPKCDKLAGALYLIDDAPLQAF
jgi:hypothetical protein